LVDKSYPGGSYFNLVTKGGDVENSSDIQYGMSMKYNTANHALFSFKKNGNYFSTIPRIETVYDYYDGYSSPELFDVPYYRSTGSDKYSRDIIDCQKFNEGKLTYNATPIFDLYTGVISDPSNEDYSKYGGNSFDALYNNSWIPCGEPKKFLPNIEIEYTDGDTYIQRFDLLRVFPNDLNQIPQHTEIISFICESFVNLDGRSDVNRYTTDSSLMTSSNYGLLNSVYSQKNNYFNYNILDSDLFSTSKFNNTIV